MKKILWTLALTAMFGFASCNGNKEASENDTIVTDTIVEETVDAVCADSIDTDTTVVIEEVCE